MSLRVNPRERDPVPIAQDGRLVPGPVWTSLENIAPPVFDSPTFQPVVSRNILAVSYILVQCHIHIFLLRCVTPMTSSTLSQQQ